MQSAPAQQLAQFGVPLPEDLPSESPFDAWTPAEARAESDRIDPSFSRCGDPTDEASFGAGVVQPEELVLSPVFSGTASSATLISLDVRGASLVFADPEAAAAVVVSNREPFVHSFDAAGDGEQGKRLDLTLDDYEYFQGNDNQTALHLRVVRVGRVVSVVQFVYSGQYFDDIDPDLDRLGDDVTSAVVSRLDQG